jgi:hypothetical protein
MTRILIATLALVLVAAVALGSPREKPRVAVVLAGQAAERADLRQQVERAGFELRIPRTGADQLGATHLLAAGRYGTVIAVGADRRVAIDPVARRYPGTRFLVEPADRKVLQAALEAAKR